MNFTPPLHITRIVRIAESLHCWPPGDTEGLRLYHDQYLSAAEESVKLVDEYAAPFEWAIWEDRESAQAGPGFEDVVRGWLEGLTRESGLRSLSHDLREAAEHYLVPALNQGAVRAAHPRAA